MHLGKAVDEVVLSKAESYDAVLLTHDLGFGRLMAFSKKNQPSLVIFRVQKLNAEILAGLLMKFWPQIEKPLKEGAIVIIEERDVRIRRLPIGGTELEGELSAQEPRAVYRAKPGKGKRKAKAGKR
jgi:predicted nuclease of predicted toxin-antitoxin system